MGRFYGKLGYATGTVEVKPGVWRECDIIEKDVIGIIKNDGRNIDNSDRVNPNITLNVKISFIADAYDHDNYQSIKYVKFGDSNVKWEVKSIVSINYPRIILTLGGVYNG